jgi:DNA-binding NarL/FixJ family response regulator
MKKRIVIADSQASIRQMLSLLLEGSGDFKIVAEAGTGLEALNACRQHRPDLAIVDVLLAELCGAELTRRVREEKLTAKVLLYTGAVQSTVLRKALDSRPHGMVRKQDTLSVLLDSVRVVANGGSYFSPFAAELRQAFQADDFSRFSERESEVLQMVAESRSSKQIAERLGLSAKTVENHRHRLMVKAHVHDVAGLTRYAIQQGLIDLSSSIDRPANRRAFCSA